MLTACVRRSFCGKQGGHLCGLLSYDVYRLQREIVNGR